MGRIPNPIKQPRIIRKRVTNQSSECEKTRIAYFNVRLTNKGDDEMGFSTYKNIANPHVTIHRDRCNQIKKHGGQHQYGQGSYEHHETYTDAKKYAESTGLPVKYCSFCKPQRLTEPHSQRRQTCH